MMRDIENPPAVVVDADASRTWTAIRDHLEERFTVSPAVREVIAVALEPSTYCGETGQLFDAFCADSRAKSTAHLERVEAEAFRLGREVGAYSVTLADAQARIERLLEVRNPRCPEPLRLVPLPVGSVAARTAFDAGLAAAQRVTA